KATGDRSIRKEQDMIRKLLIALGAAALLLLVVVAGRSEQGEIPWKDPAPIACTSQEQKILDVLADMYLSQREGMWNVQPEDGRILRLLTEAAGARHVVEIGTSNGYSGIWFCLALRTTGGKLTTYEMDPDRAALARANFERAGVGRLVTLVEGDAHEAVDWLSEPIDILHLDADKAGYVDYLNKLLPLVRPGGLILAHNTTNMGGGMQDYIEAVTTNPDLETKFIHTHDQGIGVTLKKRTLADDERIGKKAEKKREPDVVFVPTPQDVVERMLELANVKKNDLLYDLGCGDGRIVVTAAKKHGCKAIGYDVDPERIAESLENVEKNRVGGLVKIEQEDIFTLDLSKANVITLYLLPELNVRLIPQLEKLKPGSRIVSHDFSMEGVEPDEVVRMDSEEDSLEHSIYLWTTPLKKKNNP
ncbi:MAG: class I SAM-dependent methyltransferase, partial [Phycisphaerales bacterium]